MFRFFGCSEEKENCIFGRIVILFVSSQTESALPWLICYVQRFESLCLNFLRKLVLLEYLRSD